MVDRAAELHGVADPKLAGESLELSPQGPIADDVESGAADLLMDHAKRPQQCGLILDGRERRDVDQPPRGNRRRKARGEQVKVDAQWRKPQTTAGYMSLRQSKQVVRTG